MNNFKIEKLTEKYIESVFDIETKLLGKCDKNSIESTLHNKKLNYYLLIENEKLIGFFECFILSPEAELYDIVVDEKYQGNGYSKIMMDYFINLAKGNSVDTIFLEVNSINNKAINLYRKYGFVEYSIRKNYYGENDAILMKLELKCD